MRHLFCGVFASLLAVASAGAGVVHLPYFPINGDSAGDRFGLSVSGAGDVNGDGFDDLIVGADGDDNNGASSGSARVLSGATGAILYTFNGDIGDWPGDFFGSSVSGAGDVNGDGFDDLIVGAPLDDNNGVESGSARVFSGADGAILYTFNGDSAEDYFGSSVSGAGDVNGDGFDDVIVGARLDDNNGFSSGSARVFSGATGAILYTWSGESAGDQLGNSVSGAGDVNGDGFDDLIVGAHRDDTNNGGDSGSARVFSGATGAILYTFNGDSAFARFGVSVSGAGDVNGDGFDDVIVGANIDFTKNGDASGSARVFSGATGAILYTFIGDSAFDQFGYSVSGAGDVNGDGFDDLIVGAFVEFSGGSGSARVFSGADGAILYTFDGDSAGDFFGISVSGAGDVNGDGFDDLIVGAYYDDNNGEDSGSARVFFSVALPEPPTPCPGDADGDGDLDFADLNILLSGYNTSCAPLFAASAALAQVVHLPYFPFNGDSAFDRFGASVSGAGDVDGDGFDDLIVGAYLDDNNGDGSGSARVLSGATGAILYTFNGDSAGDFFGSSVSGAGDVNGDGFDDLIVGAYGDDNNGGDSGSARVFSGATGAILYTFNGDSAGDQFGISVSGAGDVNGDGFDDVIVGADSDDNNGSSSGSARVFSGASGAILYTFNGDSAFDLFGASVSGAGDVNGDGFDDLIVGAYADDNNGASSGSARVFSGADGAILYTFNGDSAGDRFGASVSGAGDVNGEGFDDLIVGAYFDDDNGGNSGSARVFSGADGAILYTFNGDSADDQFGYSVSGAGDVNGDGVADLIVGARLDDNNADSSGSARVFSGADGAILYTFNGDSAFDLFGASVSGAGDVNGDGFDDMIVGALSDDNNGEDSGSARVFFSYALPTSPKPCPGDADGDGDLDFADLNILLSGYNTSCAP